MSEILHIRWQFFFILTKIKKALQASYTHLLRNGSVITWKLASRRFQRGVYNCCTIIIQPSATENVFWLFFWTPFISTSIHFLRSFENILKTVNLCFICWLTNIWLMNIESKRERELFSQTVISVIVYISCICKYIY